MFFVPLGFPSSIQMNRTETLTANPASLHSLVLPIPAYRTPFRAWPDTIPGQIGQQTVPNRTPFQWRPKTVRFQPGTLSAFNRNGVRFESEHCPAPIGMGVRFAPEYAFRGWPPQDLGEADRVRPPADSV